MNDARLARYRDFLRHQGRQILFKTTIPKVKGILDNYVRSRRGELNPATVILWNRVFFAIFLAVLLIGGLAWLVGPGTLATAVACAGMVGAVGYGARFLVRRIRSRHK